MTDKAQDASDFSFRTFDIYRRFVEVLQHKPAYLKEFKNGSPKEETCLDIIKRVFQSQQDEGEIKKYLQYFANHAKMMAGHAEKLPDNWNEAIDYTDRYIKEIRNYLKNKGISVRSRLDSVEKIAKDIAKHLHPNPSARQIEAIRYYLKYDLRNPKKNNVSFDIEKKSKSKSKKSSKSFDKSKTINDKLVEKEEKDHVQKKNDEPPVETVREPVQEPQHFVQIRDEKDSNNDETTATLEFEYIETEIIVDDLLETNEQDYKITQDTDIFNDENDAIPEPGLFFNDENNAEMHNTNEAKKVEDAAGFEQIFKTHTTNSSEFKNGNDDKCPNYNNNLKRKSSSPLEIDHYCSLKKQLQHCRRIPNNLQQKQTVTKSHAVRIKNVSYNSSDSEINVDNDDDEWEKQENTLLTMNRFEVGNESERTSFGSETSKQSQDSIFNLKSQVKNMSYTTGVKYMDLVTTFCELKNAISREELFTMQQIREKIYFKSLNEQSSM